MSASGTPRTKSLGRAVMLLHAIDEADAPPSASELARRTGMPRSTVTRTLRTLADVGFVDEEGAGWRVGDGLVRLARRGDPHRELVELATPILTRLRDQTGQSALLAAPRGRPGMEIVLQVDPVRHVGVASWVGVEVPLHASSAGKLILAELDDDDREAWLRDAERQRFTERTLIDAEALRDELATVRRRGWADLVDELEDGLASISAAVRSPDGPLAAVVGLSGPTFRLGRDRRRELLPRLRRAADELEAALGSTRR